MRSHRIYNVDINLIFQEYRRFQVTFEDTSSVSRLVDYIKDIVPCKASAPVAASQTLNAASSTPVPVTSAVRPEAYGAPCYSSGTQLALSQADLNSDSSFGFGTPGSHRISNQSPQVHLGSDFSIGRLSSTINPTTPSGGTPPLPQPITQPQSTKAKQMQNRARVPIANPASIQGVMHTSSIPTPPSSSQLRLEPAPPPAHFNDPPQLDISGTPSPPVCSTEPGSAIDPFIRSLYEACRLDQLPQEQLKMLIAEVIREDGFKQLVSSHIDASTYKIINRTRNQAREAGLNVVLERHS